MSLVEQEKGMETYMFERKMDNCKPCGGAIPLCMIDEFSLPEKIVDRKVSTHAMGTALVPCLRSRTKNQRQDNFSRTRC